MLDGVRDVLSSLICSMVFAKAVSFCHLLFLFLLIFLLFGYDNLTLGDISDLCSSDVYSMQMT